MAQPTAFDNGGIHLDSTTPMNIDDPALPKWLHDWVKGTGQFKGLPPFTGTWTTDDNGKVLTRGMPGGESGRSSWGGNRDHKGQMNWNNKAFGDLGGILGSGSPGNSEANFGSYTGGPGYMVKADNGAILGAPGGSGVLEVIYANPASGQKFGEADGDFVGPGTDQSGYYRNDWKDHTGHVHTSFATGPDGSPYGLPKGTDIRQGQGGFPSWVYGLASQFGLEASTYAGHQEGSGFNRGIDWWPRGHADMSGASYSDDERSRLQTFAQFVSTSGVFAKHGGGANVGVGNHPNEGGDSGAGGMPSFSGGDSGGGFSGGGSGGGFSGGDSGGGSGGGSGGLSAGSGGVGGGGSMPELSGGLGGGSGSPSDPKQQAAAAIVAEGRRRGYTDEQIQWVLADSIGESGLSSTVSNGDHKGLFQQDSGYAGRDTLQGQVSGFYDRLDKTNPNMDIGDRIAKKPSEGGVEGGGYGPDWISGHLGEAQGYMTGAGGRGGAAAAMGGNRKVRELNDKITDLTTQIRETQAEIDHPKGNKARTQDATDKLNDRLAKLNRELGEAKSDLSTTSTTGAGGGRGQGSGPLAGLSALFGGGGEGDDDSLKSLADIGTNGLMQSFLPPGFINPFGTTAMHAGSVIFSFLGALMSGKGSNMAGALMSGKGSNMVGAARGGGGAGGGVNVGGGQIPAWGSFSPGGMPNAAQSGFTGGGPSVDNSQHFEGANFGYSHEDIQPTLTNAKAATSRATGTIDSSRMWSA